MAQEQPPEARSSHLQRQQQEKGFHAVETTIYKVPHEEVVGLRDIATHLWERESSAWSSTGPSLLQPPLSPSS